MKKLVLTLLCVGFANFAMANEADILTNKYILQVAPLLEVEEQELKELFNAFEKEDYTAIKEILDIFPDLLNTQTIINKEASKTPLAFIVSSSLKSPNKIKLINFLQDNYKLDLNQICLILDNFNTFYILDTILLNKKDDLELFEFLANHKVKVGISLSILIRNLEKKANELYKKGDFVELNKYLKSLEYQNLRTKYKPYFEAIFKNYTAKEIYKNELYRSGEYFIKTNDIELFKLFIDIGIKNNNESIKIVFESLVDFARKNKNTNIEILKLLEIGK